MVTIIDSQLRHTIYETVYDLVSAAKSGYGASVTPGLYAGYPDFNDVSFPLIIMPNVKVEMSNFAIGESRTSRNNRCIVTIMVFAKRNEDLDLISDGITNTLVSNPFTGAYLVYNSEDDGFITGNNQKIKSKVLAFTYNRRS